MENIRHKQTMFVMLGGVVFTILFIGYTMLLGWLGYDNFFTRNILVYVVEFGLYCLALFIYKETVSRILWFSQAVSVLIVLTLVKIVLTTLILFILFSTLGLFVEPGIYNLLALLGPFVRGFVFELVAIGVAAKIFETDIFEKQRSTNKQVIDDL